MELTTEPVLRTELAAQYRRVAGLGLNELSSGNLSCRLDDAHMLISPSGASEATIDAGTVVRAAFDGDHDGVNAPSSEWRMHAAIYRAHPHAGAVVHTHSDHCVAVACQGQALPGFHYLIGTFGGADVPCVPYATFGSQRLADAAADALRHRSACLLANHGMICRGPDLTTAVDLAQLLEITCRQYLLACRLGEPRRLTDAEWAEFFEQADRVGYRIHR